MYILLLCITVVCVPIDLSLPRIWDVQLNASSEGESRDYICIYVYSLYLNTTKF